MTPELRTVIDCATYALQGLAEICEYGWDDQFARQEMRGRYTKIQEKLKDIDFSKLDVEELKIARFGHWDADIWLCPLYLAKLLKPGVDSDTRMGCIADGWRLKDGHLNMKDSADINSNSTESKLMRGSMKDDGK